MFPFEVDPTSDLPLWVQLRNRIAYLINDGTLAPGDKLPTVRGLASEISINYNTVNKAYLSLVSDGYLESTRGRGVFVTDLGAKMGAEGEGEADAVLDECIASLPRAGHGAGRYRARHEPKDQAPEVRRGPRARRGVRSHHRFREARSPGREAASRPCLRQ